MIPKIIHYCWFGGAKKDKLSKQCIKTWHKKLKDYEFIEWNESNFDVESVPYVKQAYEAKRWAFVCDYVRFWAVKTRGGVYLDCDVKVLKPLDPLLDCEAFTSFEGAHKPERPMIEAAVFGSAPNGKWVSDILRYFDGKSFIDSTNGDYRSFVLPRPVADITIEKYGLVPNGEFQQLDGITVYPKEFLSPLNGDTKENVLSEKSYTIHLFNNSYALSKERQIHNQLVNKYGKTKAKIIMIVFHPISALKINKTIRNNNKDTK